MDLLKDIKKTKVFKQLYSLPFKNKGVIPKDLRVVLFVNACYGSGDKVFCLKIYNYIKEWYGIECTIMSSTPEYFLKNGIKKVYGVKIPGKKYVECANIKSMKIYNVDSDGTFMRRTTPKEKFDIILVTPWIGTDYDPDHKAMRIFFPYSNRFNTFLFSSYNPPSPHLYDFPMGIGKNYYGILLTTPVILQKPKFIVNPFLMVHLSYYHSVNINKCFDNFIKLMCKKYYKKYNKLDVIIPKLVLEDESSMRKLIKYIKMKGYYDNVEIITEKRAEQKYNENDSVIRFRAEILPLPFKEYTNLFNYSLPDVLTTGNQSVSDIVSCCKNFNIYYQIMPWERPFAAGLNNSLKPQYNYLKNVKTSCGIEKMAIDKQSNLRLIEQNNDFRVLGKAKLDRIFSNIRAVNNDKIIKEYVKIVMKSRKRSAVLEKFKRFLNI